MRKFFLGVFVGVAISVIVFVPLLLGERREWAGPRCKLDAGTALTTLLDVVSARAGKHAAAVIALPGYLLPDQRGLVEKAAEQARLRVFGTVDGAVLVGRSRQRFRLDSDVGGGTIAVDTNRQTEQQAVSTLGLVRRRNRPSLPRYLEQVEAGCEPPAEVELLTSEQRGSERVMRKVSVAGTKVSPLRERLMRSMR